MIWASSASVSPPIRLILPSSTSTSATPSGCFGSWLRMCAPVMRMRLDMVPSWLSVGDGEQSVGEPVGDGDVLLVRVVVDAVVAVDPFPERLVGGAGLVK